MILTSVIGMLLATPQWVPIDILILGNLGIALCAGSAAAVNHVVDRHVDDKMARTANRPIAQGRLTPNQAILFAMLTGLAGMAVLIIFTNLLTAWLTLASLYRLRIYLHYVFKTRHTTKYCNWWPAGASPPLLGWVAVTGEIHHNALLLVLIIFAWTPPHFWALAVHRKDEYAEAEIPMLPVTHGEDYTKINIFLYTVMLVVISVLPYLTGLFGWLYLSASLLLGMGFLYHCWQMWRNRDTGIKTFRFSIVYLMALFAIMLLDHYLIEKAIFPIQF